MIRLVDGAEHSVRVVQVSIDRNLPLVRALERAARRGVRVRVLLSDAWYTREENRNLTEELNRRAERRDWPLTARLARSAGRYDTVHAKGLVVDGEHAAVGSLNWNDHAVRNNREVVLVLEGEAVGGYYARVFDADWSAGRQFPVGVLVAVALGAVLALALARRIRFGSAADDGDGAGTIGWRPRQLENEQEED
jgi:phosphatidylserine/phosphatidylglycerophosphate/cardiolipin synthase-like enzyme